jgi:hypothetical protein
VQLHHLDGDARYGVEDAYMRVGWRGGMPWLEMLEARRQAVGRRLGCKSC